MSSWNDGIGSRGRRPFLFLFPVDGSMLAFKGESIPGVCVVTGTTYEKNGKWSNTTFRFVLGAGVRTLEGREGWETGSLHEGLKSALKTQVDTWEEMTTALGVSEPVLRAFLAVERPGLAQEFDNIRVMLGSLTSKPIVKDEDFE